MYTTEGSYHGKRSEPLADSRFKYSPRCLPKAPSVFQHWRPPGYGTKVGRSGSPCSGATKLTLYGSEYVLQCILMVTQLQYRCIGAIRILFYGVMYILVYFTRPQGRFRVHYDAARVPSLWDAFDMPRNPPDVIPITPNLVCIM